MSTFTERISKKIDMVFVMALLILFAATTFALVLIGAKHYRQVTNNMTTNHDNRTAASYLTEKIRQNDCEEAIALCTIQDTPALSFLTTEADVSYITYIYFYDGYLRELVVTESSVFSLSSGQPIVALGDIHFSMQNANLIRAEINDLQGNTQTIYIPLHAQAGKEDA